MQNMGVYNIVLKKQLKGYPVYFLKNFSSSFKLKCRYFEEQIIFGHETVTTAVTLVTLLFVPQPL